MDAIRLIWVKIDGLHLATGKEKAWLPPCDAQC